MSKIPKHLDQDSARIAEMEGAQMLLYAMDALGEHVAGFQMEINGVVESVIVRRVSQTEFVTIMNDAARAAARASAPRPGGA
jgi:hypothetical protein